MCFCIVQWPPQSFAKGVIVELAALSEIKARYSALYAQKNTCLNKGLSAAKHLGTFGGDIRE